MIAALFVQEGGCYYGLHSVDPWPESRDARNYKGDLPVVAHPPCQLWGKMARVNYKRWGGEHNRPGNDGGCFEFALKTVNLCGGVLEHPAQTYAWEAYGLKKAQGYWMEPIRRRLGLRGLAKRIRAQSTKGDLALLQGEGSAT